MYFEQITDGLAFENYCAELLRANGYVNVVVTQASGDYGIDVFAERDGISYAIQCKLYSSHVGISAVQEAISGRIYYNRDVAVVMTNNIFTQSAQELARSSGTMLWDKFKLEDLEKSQKYFGKNKTYRNGISTKSKVITLILAIFLGFFGVHRFYVGKVGTGILWLCTCGLCEIGWIHDIIKIATGTFHDGTGLPIVR